MVNLHDKLIKSNDHGPYLGNMLGEYHISCTLKPCFEISKKNRRVEAATED